jgi:rare lipoprotein A (peptidoglycan hydrolase)
MRLRLSIGLPLALLLVSGGAMADPSTTDPAPHTLKAKAKAGDAEARKAAAAKRQAREQLALRSADRRRTDVRPVERQSVEAEPRTRQADADQHVGRLRVVGGREIGTAAWYGGRYIGRRTSSGSTLDRVHATAAHRSLPLNSLARVTNLHNGRSVVVRVTDRGPFNNAIIDVSPSAADELDMKSAGLAPVVVEQVVEVPPDAR